MVTVALGFGLASSSAVTVADIEFRRATSAAAVLLLHFGLLGAFLFFASTARTVVRSAFREIVVTFPAASPTHPSSSEIKPQFLSPANPVLPAAPGQLFAPQPQTPSAGAISGVGRALFGCDPQTLERLPAKERAGCLHLPQHGTSQSSLLVPAPDPNSPFTKEIEERFRTATPINRPCALGSYNDTHGLPCFEFPGGEASPISPPR